MGEWTVLPYAPSSVICSANATFPPAGGRQGRQRRVQEPPPYIIRTIVEAHSVRLAPL